MDFGFDVLQGSDAPAENVVVGIPFHMDPTEKEEVIDRSNPFIDTHTPDAESLLLVTLESSPKEEKSLPESAKTDPVKPSEPDNMIEWRKKRARMLEEQDATENRKKAEMADLARAQYGHWLQNYNELVNKTKNENREENEKFLKIDSIEKRKIGFLNPGVSSPSSSSEEIELSPWEYVAKLCDLRPNNRSIKSDVTRMRLLMLQLRASKFSGPFNKS